MKSHASQNWSELHALCLQIFENSEDSIFISLFDNATIGLYRTTPDGRILLANPALIQMLGYSSFDELAQRNLEQEGFEPDYQRSQFREQIEKEGVLKGLEATWKRKDGSQVFVRESARVARDGQGNVLYYEGIVEDISERKHAEMELVNSEKRFRALVENSLDEISLVDAHGVLIYESISSRRPLGYAPDQFVGRSLFELFHPDERAAVVQMLAQLVSQPEAQMQAVFRLQRSDGEWRWMEGVVSNLLDEPAVGALVINYRDVTERVEAQEKMRQALAEKEALLKETHHRVKNNLAVISSLLDLQAHAADDDRLRRVCKESQARIQSMIAVHEQLYHSNNLAKIDMAEYVARLIEELHSAFAPGKTELRVDVGQVKMSLDQAIPCGLILNELLTNAFKYAFPLGWQGLGAAGGEHAAANLRLGSPAVVAVSLQPEERRPGWLRLQVSDNGAGLPCGLDLTSTCTLGVRLVRSLAGQLHGELEIESSAAGGTAITLAFPAEG